MTIRHLRIFLAVYETKSMTAAAAKLYMTQPSVSQAIREMETNYGTVLFERLSHRLFVTESGKRMYQYATHIIRLFDEMEENLKEGAARGTLTVGANYTVGAALIHRYVSAYTQEYSGADMRVFINKASELVARLRSNELDIALMEETHEPDLKQVFFCDDRIVAVVYPGHPLLQKSGVTAKDLTGQRLLLREKGAGVRDLFETRMNEAGCRPVPAWESTSTTALIHAAENGMGIAVLPFQLVKEPMGAGRLCELPVQGMDFARRLAVVWHKNKYISDAIRSFVRICTADRPSSASSAAP